MADSSAMRAMRGLFVTALAVATGCASPSPAAHVDNQIDVVIVARPGQKAAPSARPDDPRIAVAQGAIARTLGHPVAFEMDAAVAAQFGERLNDALVHGMEATLRTLQRLERVRKDELSFAGPKLRKILLAYSATSDRKPPTFDPHEGTLQVFLSSRDTTLVEPSDIEVAFENAYAADSAGRYVSVDPTTIPAAEQPAYFRFLDEQSRRTARPRAIPAAEVLARVVRLYPRIVDPALKAKVQSWLVEAGRAIARPSQDADPEALRARHATFVGWLNEHGSELSAKNKDAVVEYMIEHRRIFDPQIRAGLDVVRFGGPVLAAVAQRARDHSRTAPGDDDDRSLEKNLACPVKHYSDGSQGRDRCEGGFYLAVAESSGVKRLGALVEEWGVDGLTEAALVALLVDRGTAAALELADALADDPAAGAASIRILGDFDGWTGRGLAQSDHPPDPQEAIAWVRRSWTARPRDRGALLYALTQIGRSRDGLVPWGKLTALLGTAITASELSAFLDQGRQAIWNVDLTARGLSAGWSRAGVLVPKFERWLAQLVQYDDGGPYRERVADRIVDTLCVSGIPGDLPAFVAFLRKRVESYPSEGNKFGLALAEPISALCPGNVAAAPAPTDGPTPRPQHPTIEDPVPARMAAARRAESGREVVLFGD